MALSSVLMGLLLFLVLRTQALEQPHGKRTKRDLMDHMFSMIRKVDQRLAAVEAKQDNSTEERLAQLETKMEGEIREKLQGVQNVMQTLESMVLELLSSRLESMVTEILTSKMKASEEKVAELVEAKTNATEERLASLEASNTETQPSPAACKYQFLYQYEKEAPHSSADLQRVTKLESELTRLQEKMSVLDKRLQENDLSVVSLHNASVLAMEGVVRSMTELVAASEQNLQSIMQNATEILASMMGEAEASQLARAKHTTALVNASMARVEKTTKQLDTRMSSVEDKLNTAMSLHAEETNNTRVICEDIQRWIEDLKNYTTAVTVPPRYRRTCQDYYDNGHRTSGVYMLQLEDGQGTIEVYCDMSIAPGWVVFQRRQEGLVDFYRNWKSYEYGFGDLNGEFWLGNRNIHRLTSAGLTQLRVDLQAWNGSTASASYSHFSVGDASSSYRLSVSGYSGTAGDSLIYHNNQKFSTHDQDNDVHSSLHCARDHNKGAWWYHSCDNSNLNGQYGPRGSSGNQYIVWRHWLSSQSLQRTELKLQ